MASTPPEHGRGPNCVQGGTERADVPRAGRRDAAAAPFDEEGAMDRFEEGWEYEAELDAWSDARWSPRLVRLSIAM